MVGWWPFFSFFKCSGPGHHCLYPSTMETKTGNTWKIVSSPTAYYKSTKTLRASPVRTQKRCAKTPPTPSRSLWAIRGRFARTPSATFSWVSPSAAAASRRRGGGGPRVPKGHGGLWRRPPRSRSGSQGGGLGAGW
jgi:hypothetical protein